MNVSIVIDPGDRHVGWAVFNHSIGRILAADKMSNEETPGLFRKMVEYWRPELVIIEAFRIRPMGSNVMSDAPTAQLIGVLKETCRTADPEVPIRMQEPSVKDVAYRSPWRDALKTVKDRHGRDAAAHGVYYYGFERKIYGKPVRD